MNRAVIILLLSALFLILLHFFYINYSDVISSPLEESDCTLRSLEIDPEYKVADKLRVPDLHQVLIQYESIHANSSKYVVLDIHPSAGMCNRIMHVLS